MVRTRVDPCPTACMSDALATEPHRQFIYIYIKLMMDLKCDKINKYEYL